MRSMTRTLFVAALALALSAPQALATAIAQIKAAEGSVEVLRNGRWRRAREGTELTVKDSIRTGEDSLAQLEFYDGDTESGATPTLVDLVPESEISIEHFEISKRLPRQRQGFIDLAKGYLRAFTKGWATGSIFSVKAGTTVCGIRGSVADIGFDPITGDATFTALDGKMFTFSVTTLPANYFDLSETEQKAAMAKVVREAVSKALSLAATLGATGKLPANSGAKNLPPGDERDAILNSPNYRSTQLSTDQVSRLRVAASRERKALRYEAKVVKALKKLAKKKGLRGKRARRELKRFEAGEKLKRGRRLRRIAGKKIYKYAKKARRYERKVDDLLSLLTQELVSSPELNGPASSQ